MDSPDTSLYKPISLSDTLTQNSKRSYRSVGAALSGSTSTNEFGSRRTGPRGSVAVGAPPPLDRSDAARREAAAMCEVLGLAEVDATPRPSAGGRSLNSAAAAAAPGGGSTATGRTREGSPVEIIFLKTSLTEKDREIAALRKELAAALRDKKDLAAQVGRLEREKGNFGSGGLDVKQMEDLERAFADQEKLLGGYQREVERQAEELDRCKSRSRRMAEHLERFYPSYEEDLGLVDHSKGSATSPAVRHRLAARASVAGAGAAIPHSVGGLSRTATVPASLGACAAIPESSRGGDPPSPADARSRSVDSTEQSAAPSPANAPAVPTAALAQHLDSVQALLRSMEARLISRDVELEAIERRAKEERTAAKAKQEELEALVAETRRQPGDDA